MSDLPPFFTVEEAAEVVRIGRLLRVPSAALEAWAGAELTAPTAAVPCAPAPPVAPPPTTPPAPAPVERAARPSRPHRSEQPRLPFVS